MIFLMGVIIGCGSTENETESVVSEIVAEEDTMPDNEEESAVDDSITEETEEDESVIEEPMAEDDSTDAQPEETEPEQENTEVNAENVADTGTCADYITYECWEGEETESYTLYYDGSRLNYLGGVYELWHEGNGELFGLDAYDLDKCILGYSVCSYEWDTMSAGMEESGNKLILEEVRGDAIMYVYEGYQASTEMTFWQIAFVANTDVAGTYYFNFISTDELEVLGFNDIYDFISCLGEVKVNN